MGGSLSWKEVVEVEGVQKEAVAIVVGIQTEIEKFI